MSALDTQGRTIWIVDAHGYGKRFVVRAGEKLTAFAGTAKGDTRVRGEFIVVTPSPLFEIALVFVRLDHYQKAARFRKSCGSYW